MQFRLLKFAPGTAAPQAPGGERVKPLVSWTPSLLGRNESGGAAHSATARRFAAASADPPPCGRTNRNRPTTSSPPGAGTVFSYVVHHAPKVPGRQLPFVVALVELEEGVRMLGELRGIDPADVQVGLARPGGVREARRRRDAAVWQVIA